MLSFSKVVTFVAVAFGTLCQAAPLIPRDVSIRAPASGPVQLKGLLTDLKTQLTIAVEPINHLTHNTATASAVLPILKSVNVIVNDAAKLLEDQLEVGEYVDELLEDVNDVRPTVDDVSAPVSDVLTVLFGALNIVYELVADTSELIAILPTKLPNLYRSGKGLVGSTHSVHAARVCLKNQCE